VNEKEFIAKPGSAGGLMGNVVGVSGGAGVSKCDNGFLGGTLVFCAICIGGDVDGDDWSVTRG
jgi:hypothetical protein